MRTMSFNQTPVITLATSGQPVQVPVLVLTGPNSDQPDPATVIGVSQNGVATSILTIAVHPTDPRAVILTPGPTAGQGSVFVNSVPGAQANLAVNFVVAAPPPVRQIFYDASRGFGPVQ